MTPEEKHEMQAVMKAFTACHQEFVEQLLKRGIPWPIVLVGSAIALRTLSTSVESELKNLIPEEQYKALLRVFLDAQQLTEAVSLFAKDDSGGTVH